MRITVNGDVRDVAARCSLLDLLEALELPANMTVVERNGEIVEPARFADVELAENDVLELVRFVGGG